MNETFSLNLTGMNGTLHSMHSMHMTYPSGCFGGVEILHLGQIVDFLRERSQWWWRRHESPAHARRVV